MSPLSEKYFQYRNLPKQEGPADDTDRYCPMCGYNLRGLPIGRACPECGSGTSQRHSSGSSSSGKSAAHLDPLLAGSEADRQQWYIGLGLATLAIGLVLIARWMVFLGSLFGSTNVAASAAAVVMLSMTALWIPAVWIATPRSLDSVIRHGRALRWAIRIIQLLWLPGYALLALRMTLYAGTNVEATMQGLSLLVRGVAGIGLLAFIWLMMRVARHAELEDASRRFNNVIFFLPLPAMIVAAVYGAITWLAAVLLLLVFVAWTWLMLYLLLGLNEMFQHVRWALRQAHDAHGREERMRETRRQLDQHVQGTIRPTSSTNPPRSSN